MNKVYKSFDKPVKAKTKQKKKIKPLKIQKQIYKHKIN